MKRWIKWLLVLPILLAVFALGSVWFLLHTEAGAAWVIDLAKARVPGTLNAGEPRGNFASGLIIPGLEFESDGLSVQADQVALSFTPRWPPLAIRIHFLELKNLRVQLPEATGVGEQGGLPQTLALPFPVELERFTLDGLAVLDAGGQSLFQAAQLNGAGTFLDKAELRSMVLETEFGQILGEGVLSLEQPYTADASVDANLLIPLGGQQDPLSLRLESRLGGQIEAYELVLDAAAELGNFGADLEGTIDFQDASLEGEAEWRSFSWPLEQEVPQVLSPAGQVTLSGTFDDWRVTGDAEVKAPGFADGVLAFDAKGDQEHVNADIREGRLLGGSLSGQVNYNWAEGGIFDLRIETENLSTGPLYSPLPAVVSATFSASGRQEPMTVFVDVERLQAMVSGQEVSASGKAGYGPGELRFDRFELRAQGSSVVLNGSLDRPDGLNFEADVREIGAFMPGASGILTAGGNVRMAEGQPRLQLAAKGEALSWRDISMPSVVIRDMPSLSPGALASLRVELSNPEYAGQTLDYATLDLDLGENRQSATLSAGAGEYRLSTALAGGIHNRDAPMTDWAWLGTLEDLVLAGQGDSLVLGLEVPASLSLAASEARMDSACLAMAVGPRACFEGSWEEESGLLAQMKLHQASLELLNLMVQTDFAYTQLFDGEARFSAAPGSLPDIMAAFNISSGYIHFADDDEPILQTGDGRIGLEVSEGSLTSGFFDLPLPGQGEIDLNFEIADLKLGLDSALSGQLRLDMEDLDALAVVLPWVDQLGGRLDVNLDLSGTAGSPRIDGGLKLVDGSLLHSSSGLRISEVQLAGQLEGRRETRLEGSFRAVEGKGKLLALVDLNDVLSPVVTVNVSGEALKLFDSKDLQLLVEPDFQVAWNNRGINLDGRIDIPAAMLAPAMIPVAPVTESADLKIVAGEVPGEAGTEEANSRLAIHGTLDISLGNDVKLDISVAKLDVSGSTRFTWTGDQIPMANGSLNLEGDILAFGQLLEIDRGTIGFPDVPADNPHLNIQAERRIYGNSEVRRAGLLVTGTLRRPVIEPYTDPITTRERAQTLLITGSDFNMERGVGALNVGTYIAPRLFVSYGIGVFEDGNVFGIRYDLSETWGIKATSGERGTGADISYTIDQ
ncbi:MAG: translocation/assembly module TamB domain-containing protein [Xanthomonadales bacterium]|jgi:translocation and assembly module TamB|nr:translocation/assembly module TamB domain-containing protein [Xanthomonadales bacterium]